MMDFYYVEPKNTKATVGIVLIHEVWGLTDHIKTAANRLAEAGYAVIAPDLISHTGVPAKVSPQIMKEIADPSTRDEAQKKMREAMAPINSPEFAKETMDGLNDCVEFLEKEKGLEKIAVMGFCFGGTYSYSLATERDDLIAALPFYGHAPENESAYDKIACPVYAFYGEQDERLIAQLPMIKENMAKYHKDFQSQVYPNTGHAFMNETNPMRYNLEASEDAWGKVLEFLAEQSAK